MMDLRLGGAEDMDTQRTLPTVEALVGELYGSLAEGASIPDAVSAIGDAIASHVTALHREDPRGGGSMELAGALSLAEMGELHADYERRFQGQNLWVVRSLDSLPRLGVQATEDIVPWAELQESEYYRHMLRRMDVAHAVGVSVAAERSGERVIVSFNRSAAAGAMTREEVELVKALRPHLVSAHALHANLLRLQEGQRSLRAAFDRSVVATLVLDRAGWVLEHNHAAEKLFVAREHGIHLAAGGVLAFQRPEARERFLAALRRIALGGAATQPVLVAARAGGGARNCFMHLCRAPNDRVVATLIDSDCAGDAEYSRQALQAALGITAQEARVCLALRALGDPDAVALQLGVRLSTVRSHLKRAFEKSGASRQSELVRVVDRIVSTAPMT